MASYIEVPSYRGTLYRGTSNSRGYAGIYKGYIFDIRNILKLYGRKCGTRRICKGCVWDILWITSVCFRSWLGVVRHARVGFDVPDGQVIEKELTVCTNVKTLSAHACCTRNNSNTILLEDIQIGWRLDRGLWHLVSTDSYNTSLQRRL